MTGNEGALKRFTAGHECSDSFKMKVSAPHFFFNSLKRFDIKLFSFFEERGTASWMTQLLLKFHRVYCERTRGTEARQRTFTGVD